LQQNKSKELDGFTLLSHGKSAHNDNFMLITYFVFFYSLRETHEIAQAQQQKNAKLREAFGISDYFVEGTSFDPERKAREELAKSEAIQKELQAEKEADKVNRKKYALIRTPSLEKSDSPTVENNADEKGKVDKKKKKKRDA
jgi:serine/arginine repetitive matrix protein 2